MGVRIWLALVALALLASGCGDSSKAGASKATLVQVEVAAKTTALAADRYSATVQPATQVSVAFDNGGYVEWVATTPGTHGRPRALEPGDPVRRGQVLAEVRQADYSDKVTEAASQVTQAQAGTLNAAAQVDSAVAGVRGADANVEKARAALVQAEAAVRAADAQRLEAVAAVRAADAQMAYDKVTWERTQALFDQQSATANDRDGAWSQFVASRAQADQAREQVRAAEASLNEARAQARSAAAQVDAARSQADQARAQVEQARAGQMSDEAQLAAAAAQMRGAERAQEDSRLKSPVDGVVLQRNVDVGALVGSGTVGYTVADLRRVKVVFGVVDKQLELLRPGMPVTVLAPALAGRTFPGTIQSLAASADSNTRTFQVEVAVDNPDQALKAGMVVSLSFQGSPQAPVELLTVPLNAVQGKDASDYKVFTVEGEGEEAVAREHRVEVGEVLGNRVVVKKGIQPGDRVIVGGVEYVTDGGPVRVVAR